MSLNPPITIHIASPCTEAWDRMRGDDLVRRCAKCQLNVYNLSAMRAGEVRELVQRHEGRRMCVRFFQRADGTVLTADCPVRRLERSRRFAKAWRRSLVGFAAASSIASALVLHNHAARTTPIPEVILFYDLVEPEKAKFPAPSHAEAREKMLRQAGFAQGLLGGLRAPGALSSILSGDGSSQGAEHSARSAAESTVDRGKKVGHD